MDNMVKTIINGEERELNYSIEVMFDMRDKYESIQKALEIIAEDTRDSYDAVRWFAVKMANDAELCRRDAGYDPRAMLSEKDVSLRMSPLEYEVLKGAVVDAITRGYRRETSESKEKDVDLGLEELRAKKTGAGE